MPCVAVGSVLHVHTAPTADPKVPPFDSQRSCAALFTVTDCWTCGAALKVAFPAWFASIRHVPAAVKLTTPPDKEQPVLAARSVGVRRLEILACSEEPPLIEIVLDVGKVLALSEAV